MTRYPLARGPVLAAVVVQAALLTATSNAYGYHRDELYFRLLRPSWGYVDQPPLTPLVVRVMRQTIADEVWALRLPATVAAAVSVWLIAGITREAGGDRRAQVLAAWGYAFASFPLVLGHVLLTTSIDQPVWLGVLLLIMRARLRGQDRYWWWAGALIGVGTYNKLLIVVLLVALLAGVLIAGPRRLVVSRPVLTAAAVAALIAVPNVIYQASNGWPQWEFGRQLAAHHSSDVRTSMWPLLVLLLGPPLVAVWLAGLVAVWRRASWSPIRFLAPAFGVLVVLVFVMGSQPYYEFGLLSVLFALGCIPTAEWIARGRPRRLAIVVTLAAINAAVSAVIALPLIPVTILGNTPIPGVNQAARDTVGWPEYVKEIAAVYRALPAADRSRATLIASNYGEAGALDRYGPAEHLPHAYSAQNQLYFQAVPPAGATIAVIVGGQADQARHLFSACRAYGSLDNHLGVDNEEQGQPIEVCRDPIGGWAQAWRKLKHED